MAKSKSDTCTIAITGLRYRACIPTAILQEYGLHRVRLRVWNQTADVLEMLVEPDESGNRGHLANGRWVIEQNRGPDDPGLIVGSVDAVPIRTESGNLLLTAKGPFGPPLARQKSPKLAEIKKAIAAMPSPEEVVREELVYAEPSPSVALSNAKVRYAIAKDMLDRAKEEVQAAAIHLADLVLRGEA